MKGCGSGDIVMKENETMLGMPILGARMTTWSWPEISYGEYSGMGSLNVEYPENAVSGSPGLVLLTCSFAANITYGVR